MTDGLNVNYSFNDYEDTLNDYLINSPSQTETNPIFDQVKDVVKETILNNPEQAVSHKNVTSRFILLKGSLNSKLKNIFHDLGKSSTEEKESEIAEFKESKNEEEATSNEENSLNLETDIESLTGEEGSFESKEIEKEDELEGKKDKEDKAQESFSEGQETGKSEGIHSFIEEGKTHKEGNKNTEGQDNQVNEVPYEAKEETNNSNEEKEVSDSSKTDENSEEVIEKKERIEKSQSEQKEESKELRDRENEKQEEKVKSEEELKEEVQLAEDSEGDSMSEIEQMEVQKEEKKEEHSEEHEKEGIEGKEEESSLLPGVVEIDNLENKDEEFKGEKGKENKVKNTRKPSINIPVDLITFIKQNLSEILSHKSYSINHYNCVFYAEDVAVFSLSQFSDIMVSIFRSSVSSMEAEKIYQTRQKAKKFINDNDLSLLQVSDDKLLIINSKYGPVKVLLEKKLSSSFVLSDLVGHDNYTSNKYVIKEALKQFVIFMCDFGLSSGFRYKLRILPQKSSFSSSIALYCSYSISVVNNFKLFKETLSILNKEDFEFIFHVIEAKLDKRRVNQIMNYWRLKQ